MEAAVEPLSEPAAEEDGCALQDDVVAAPVQPLLAPDARHVQRRGQKAQGWRRLANAGARERHCGCHHGRCAPSHYTTQVLSPELAAFMGVREARRSEVVKQLWAHIKANGLQARQCRARADRLRRY